MTTRQKIGASLKEIRISKGISMNAIATSQGIKWDVVQAIERGRSNYTVDSLIAYCDAIEIELCFFIIK